MTSYYDSKKALEPDTLDLPDWTDADDSAGRLSPDAAFRLCENYPEELPETVKRLQSQRRAPCPVEFVL